MTGHPSRAWSDKGGPFLTPDERRQKATFDTPGKANLGPQRASWNDAAGPMAEPPPDRGLEQRVQDVLDRLPPGGRRVMETAGRRASDRLADEAAWRRDQGASAEAMSAEARRICEPARRTNRVEAARQRIADTRPGPGDYPGRGQQVDAYELESWLRHFQRQHGLEVDDAEYDSWLDEQGVDGPDTHYRSPDLDDLDDNGM